MHHRSTPLALIVSLQPFPYRHSSHAIPRQLIQMAPSSVNVHPVPIASKSTWSRARPAPARDARTILLAAWAAARRFRVQVYKECAAHLPNMLRTKGGRMTWDWLTLKVIDVENPVMNWSISGTEICFIHVLSVDHNCPHQFLAYGSRMQCPSIPCRANPCSTDWIPNASKSCFFDRKVA